MNPFFLGSSNLHNTKFGAWLFICLLGSTIENNGYDTLNVRYIENNGLVEPNST